MPAERVIGEQALGVDRALGVGPPRRAVAGDERRRVRVGKLVARDPGQRQERGGKVDGRDRVADALPARARHRLAGEDQGHVQGGLVDEDAVGLLAVLAEALPVIGRHRDEQVARAAGLLQGLEQPAELRVAEGDLSLVRMQRGLTPGRRRLVGHVRIEEVQPDEEALPGSEPGEPGQRVVDHLVGGALDVQVSHRLPGRLWGVIDLEALVEAEARVQHEAPHEGRGAPAPLGEHLRDQPRLRRQCEHGVVVHSVGSRIDTGEDRSVRGERDGCRGDRPLEENPLPGEPVEGGRPRSVAAVGTDAVGPRRVEGDEQDARRPRALPRAAGEECEQQAGQG